MEPETDGKLVPVTLLTGFLGAGKTTRLNAALVAGHARIAVVENELGALGVDASLVANRHDDGVVELTNGCLCCSAEVDLVGALEGLARRRATRPFDRVIIETTGLADVGPVVSLLRDPDDLLAEEFVFDGVVTIVDAANFQRWALAPAGPGGCSLVASWASGFSSEKSMDTNSGPQNPGNGGSLEAIGPGRAAVQTAFFRQVALADRVVVSKADLVGGDAIEDVRKAVLAVNPFVDVFVDGCGDIGGSLALARGSRHGAAECAGMALPLPTGDQRAAAKNLCGAFSPQRRSHLAGVDTLTLRLATHRPMQETPFRALVAALLSGTWAMGQLDLGEVWRVKGLVQIAGVGTALVQGVGDQVVLEEWPHGWGEAGGPFLVIIG
eukprot:CAMPEP_0117536602 /NCGR_PEP_ID=MMETSP0784-20121206/41537_1 /TAXON_ID=39447 /ORGANISM="" /LENGTH=381 /DNA_ID=CAMNT_0005333169 /DNA_START=53 /DNA_END=1194 /DNA_ORIENTATION=-